MIFIEYSFLGEFDLLRHARNDVCQENWAKLANHKATIQYLGLLRAREELARLEVEIPRLHTRMVDEQLEYEDAIKRTEPVNTPLAGELQNHWVRRQLVNEVHERRLHWIVKLPEYRGLQGPGIRQGKSGPIALRAPDSRDMVTIIPDDMSRFQGTMARSELS